MTICRYLIMLFVGTRMRALQSTQQKGAQQGWAQDGMHMATWAVAIQFWMCLAMMIFSSKIDTEMLDCAYAYAVLATTFTVYIVPVFTGGSPKINEMSGVLEYENLSVSSPSDCRRLVKLVSVKCTDSANTVVAPCTNRSGNSFYFNLASPRRVASV